MDYYTTNFGGTYHDQFYTQANITASYKAYVSHVLNRNNTLTGVLYKVSLKIIVISMFSSIMIW